METDTRSSLEKSKNTGQMWKCSCGKSNPGNEMFCLKCGEPNQGDPPRRHTSVSSVNTKGRRDLK